MGFSFRGEYVRSLLGGVAEQVAIALQTAKDRVASGKGDGACLRWFGDNSSAFKHDLQVKLQLLHSAVAVKTIVVGYASLRERDEGMNAEAWNDGQPHLGMGEAPPAPPGEANIILNHNFGHLQRFLHVSSGDNKIDTKPSCAQSKFATLVHEMSHALLGTQDLQLQNGDTAYGTRNARTLAKENPDGAKRNAENWGVFVEACGYWRQS